MLGGTITIVYSRFSSWIRSSIREVEIGSRPRRARHQDHVGLDARARAIQRRCCWPPKGRGRSRKACPSPRPTVRRPEGSARRARRGHWSASAHAGERDCCRRSTSGRDWASGRPSRCGGAPRPVHARPVEIPAVIQDPAVHDGSRGEVVHRLKHRMNVDLPHPDGPMKAVTKFFRMSSVTPRSAGARCSGHRARRRRRRPRDPGRRGRCGSRAHRFWRGRSGGHGRLRHRQQGVRARTSPGGRGWVKKW